MPNTGTATTNQQPIQPTVHVQLDPVSHGIVEVDTTWIVDSAIKQLSSEERQKFLQSIADTNRMQEHIYLINRFQDAFMSQVMNNGAAPARIHNLRVQLLACSGLLYRLNEHGVAYSEGKYDEKFPNPVPANEIRSLESSSLVSSED